jgi:hypothetical protein
MSWLTSEFALLLMRGSLFFFLLIGPFVTVARVNWIYLDAQVAELKALFSLY